MTAPVGWWRCRDSWRSSRGAEHPTATDVTPGRYVSGVKMVQAAAAAVALLLSLAGCAPEESAAPVAAEQRSQRVGVPPCEVVAPGTDGSVGDGRALVVWHSVPPTYRALFERLVAEWSTAEELEVELVPFTDTAESLQRFTDASPEERPDLLLAGELSVASLADSGLFVPAAACAERLEVDLVDDLLEPTVSAWSYADRWWGIPFIASTPVLYANRSVLAQGGIDAIPTDPVAFAAAAEAVSVATGRPAFVFDDALPAVVLEQWSARYGEPLVRDPLGAPVGDLTTPASLLALQSLAALVSAGQARQSGDVQAQALVGVYTEPLPTALGIGSSGGIGFLRTAVDSGVVARDDALVGPLPLQGQGALIGGGAWWLSARPGADPARAFDLASWLASAEVQASVAAATGYIPVHKAAPDESVLRDAWAAFPPLRVGWDQVQQSLDAAVVSALQIGPRVELRDLLNRAFARTRQGLDPGLALDEADASLQILLDAWVRTRPTPGAR